MTLVSKKKVSPELVKQNRCERCNFPNQFCYCAEVKLIHTNTLVTVVMHASERMKSSNTARVMELALPNFSLHQVGIKEQPFTTLPELPEYETYMLFPAASSQMLTPEFVATLTKPIQLVVPDGTWQQAKRLSHHQKGLVQLPRLQLPEQPASKYRLRKGLRAGGVCTLEAVAAALKIIEGEKVQEQLLQIFEVMVQRSLTMKFG